MASTAHTTGIDAHADELRRRNVATRNDATAPAGARAPEKEKSKDKVCHTTPRGCRNRLLTRRQPFSVLSLIDEYEFIWAPLIFTFFAFFTRMYKIGLSPIVTWDEAQ